MMAHLGRVPRTYNGVFGYCSKLRGISKEFRYQRICKVGFERRLEQNFELSG